MMHSDDSVEKLLAGLRDARPATGMEGRILAAVEKRAAERSAAAWWHRSSNVFRLSPAKLLLFGSAFAAAVILLVSPLIHQHGVAPVVSNGSPASTTANVNRTSHRAPATVAQSIRQTPSAKHDNSQTPHVLRVKSIRVDTARENTNSDSLALREMNAASHPAPPLPLTSQEKLLLRVIHKGDPVELAMLNPEVRSQRVAEGRAEFQQFFQPKKSEDAQ